MPMITWYFLYYIEDRIVYIEHEVMNRERAERDARRILRCGFGLNGVHEKITRVCVMPEHGYAESVIDISG